MKKLIACVIVLMIVCPVFSGCGSGYVDIKFDNADRYTVGGAQSTEKIDGLDVDWIDGCIDIVYEKTDEIRISETSANTLAEKDQLRWMIDNGTLYIKYCTPGHIKLTGLEKKLTLVLPEEQELDEAVFSLYSADLKIDRISAEKTVISTLSGDIAFNSLESKIAEISSLSGNVMFKCRDMEKIFVSSLSGKVDITQFGMLGTVEISSVSGNVNAELGTVGKISVNTVSGKTGLSALSASDTEFSTTSGDITLSTAECSGKFVLNSVSGNIGIRLPEKADFTLGYSTISGKLTNDYKCNTVNGAYVSGSGTAVFDISTMSGDLDVRAR